MFLIAFQVCFVGVYVAICVCVHKFLYRSILIHWLVGGCLSLMHWCSALNVPAAIKEEWRIFQIDLSLKSYCLFRIFYDQCNLATSIS